MKIKYEREQGMSSIYRKLRKACESSNLRRHVTILILAVAMMVPAGVYADWTGVIQSEKPAGQAYDGGSGWAGEDGTISLTTTDQIIFEGHGVVTVVVDAIETVHGAARLTVRTTSDGNDVVILEDCDHTFDDCKIISSLGPLDTDTKVTVELKGAFQHTFFSSFIGSQRGTLTFELMYFDESL